VVRYWIETLGCPRTTWTPTNSRTTGVPGLHGGVVAAKADLVVANTCAFIEAAREESIETVLALADVKRTNARLVVTGCMASVTVTNSPPRCPKWTSSPDSARV